MPIPAWIPYALKIYGAVHGSKNASALGSVMGGMRGEQMGAVKQDATESLFSDQLQGGDKKLSQMEQFINLAQGGRGELKLKGNEVTFKGDQRLMEAGTSQPSPSATTHTPGAGSKVIGAEKPEGDTLDETLRAIFGGGG